MTPVDIAAPRPHAFCSRTLYCMCCGQSLRDIRFLQLRSCQAAPNVVAVSHVVRSRRMKELLR